MKIVTSQALIAVFLALSAIARADDAPAVSSAPPAPAADATPGTPIEIGTGGLGRSFAALNKGGDFTIAYFGGSLTEGAGASDKAKTCWRALTTAWFKAQFPTANITEVDASVGGTGTDLGIYRCQQDVISHHPDLVFVEFSVNDGNVPPARIIANMDGIVRQIWKALPRAEIAFVYTTNAGLDSYPKGTVPAAVVADQQVADHYGIPSVNVGKVLSQTIRDGQGTWQSLTKDGTHPLDPGYAIYTRAVLQFLQDHRQDTPVDPPADLPAPLSPNPAENTQMVDATTITADGWTVEDSKLVPRFPRVLSCGTPGTALDFPFTGTTIGLYWLVTKDSGMIDYTIDNGPSKQFNSWDKYALQFNRAVNITLQDNLPPGSHVLHLKVAAEKADQSTGNSIRIGDILFK